MEDCGGMTCLFVLYMPLLPGESKLVKVLLDAGADPMVAAKFHLLPINVAICQDHHECVKLLDVSHDMISGDPQSPR